MKKNVSSKCPAVTSVLTVPLSSPPPKPPAESGPPSPPVATAAQGCLTVTLGTRPWTHTWHIQPRPLRSRSPSPHHSATRLAHTCGWWVRSSASLQDTPAWLWRETQEHSLAKGDIGHGASEPYCPTPATWPEAFLSQFLHLRSSSAPKTFLFMYLLLGGLGLCCCVRAFSSCGEQELLSSCGVRVSHGSGFSCCGAWALGLCGLQYLWHEGSAVVVLRLWSMGSIVAAHGFSCSAAGRIFLDQDLSLCPPLHGKVDS